MVDDLGKNLIKIKTTTVTEQIVGQIMDMIEQGVFKPGDTLPTEMEISTLLGVGRSSVREALRALQAIGIIEKSHGSTARFSQTCATSAAQYFNIPNILNSFTLLDLSIARETVEVSLAVLAARNAEDEQIRQIGKAQERFKKAVSKKNLREIPSLDFEFHKAVAESSGNQFLAQMLYMLHDLIISGSEQTLNEKYIYAASGEHRRIYEAIKQGNTEAVRTAMKKHMDGIKQKFLYKEGERSMTGKERLRCTMQHKEPDKVPIFEFLYSRPFYKEVLGFVPKVYGAETIVKCAEKVGYDFVFIPMGGVSGFNAKEDSGDIYTDEWGITYRKEPATWPIDATIKYPMSCGKDWESYVVPDANIPSRYDGVRTALKLAEKTGMGIIGNMRGPFSAAWMLFGFENFFYMMYDEPEIVDAVLTATADFAITGGLEMAKLGVDALLFSDDYGSNTQTFFSMEHFNRFILPQIKRMCDAFKAIDMPLIMHSDGHVRDVVDSCVEAGISGLHPIQRTAGMDIGEIKKTFGDKITIFGNIDNSELLVNGSPQDVHEQVKECIQLAAKGGGYCLGSDHSIHDDVPNENVLAIFEAGRKYGKYPINL